MGKILLKYLRIETQSLEIDERPLDEIEDVTELKGIGKGVGEVIDEYRKTGESSYLKRITTTCSRRLDSFNEDSRIR